MRAPNRQQLRLSGGTELSFITAGEPSRPALLLLHGTPQSARYFRDIVPDVSRVAHVIAPDLPGFGESDVLPTASFPAYGQAVSELLDRLAIGPRYIYLHDFGAPVGFHIAMQKPERVAGLIVQNANAHRTGLGPQWGPVLAYGSQPNPENEAAATAHLTFEGMRDTYLRGVPSDVAARAASQSVASVAVIVDAKGAAGAAFYARYGFLQFPDLPLRLFLPMRTIEQLQHSDGAANDGSHRTRLTGASHRDPLFPRESRSALSEGTGRIELSPAEVVVTTLIAIERGAEPWPSSTIQRAAQAELPVRMAARDGVKLLTRCYPGA